MAGTFTKKSNVIEVSPTLIGSNKVCLEEVIYDNFSSDLLIRGPFNDPSGYAEVARNLVFGLHEIGVKISIIVDYWWNGINMELLKNKSRLLQHFSSKKFNGSTLIHLSTPNNFDKDFNGYKIGYTMFEADGIPQEWIEPCNLMDEVFVPSNYNVKFFKESGINKVIRMPVGINTKEYNPNVEKLEIKNAKSFKFLSVFQWTSRKGWDKLLTGYFRAFTNKDDVSLVIKTYGADNSESAKQFIRKEIQKMVDFIYLTDRRDPSTLPQVLLYMDLISEDAIPSLYNMCNCYVTASRGEGLDLGALQAGACEKPIITTRGTAHMDFLDDNNSYLINSISRIYEQLGREHPIYKDLKIVDPDSGSLRNLFREVYNNYNKAKEKGKRLKEKIIREWDYRITANRLKNYLQDKKLI